MVNYEGLTESNFRAAVAALADETGIWVWDDGVSIVECPWFGTEGFTILYFRGDENNPWLIVEDIATGGDKRSASLLQRNTSGSMRTSQIPP